MATLTKTRTVLHRVEGTFSYRPAADAGETVRDQLVILDSEVWSEMGQPQTITVTVEPGDLLND